jgi:hypothetical protein
MASLRRSGPRTYRGLTIDRSFPSGMWTALGPAGYLRADTLAGLKDLIRHTLETEDRNA